LLIKLCDFHTTPRDNSPKYIDSLIDSSCLAKELILITRNEKDFYNFEIEMVNPFYGLY